MTSKSRRNLEKKKRQTIASLRFFFFLLKRCRAQPRVSPEQVQELGIDDTMTCDLHVLPAAIASNATRSLFASTARKAQFIVLVW